MGINITGGAVMKMRSETKSSGVIQAGSCKSIRTCGDDTVRLTEVAFTPELTEGTFETK